MRTMKVFLLFIGFFSISFQSGYAQKDPFEIVAERLGCTPFQVVTAFRETGLKFCSFPVPAGAPWADLSLWDRFNSPLVDPFMALGRELGMDPLSHEPFYILSALRDNGLQLCADDNVFNPYLPPGTKRPKVIYQPSRYFQDLGCSGVLVGN